MTWEGAIIDESLDNKRIYNLIKTTKTTITPLTGEEEKGDIHLHEIEIEDKNKEEFVKICKQDIKYGWYIDISKDKGTEKQRTIIIFKDKEFEFTKDNPEIIKQAEEYGSSVGIIREQMEFVDMLDS